MSLQFPNFSIITATFNSEKTLRRTIESVLNQSNWDYEYIIVDGGSVDLTISIIESYKELFKTKKIVFKWISEPDKGIYDAWNKGLELATGKWISFLGSDDIYLSGALMCYQEAIDIFTKEDTGTMPHLLYSNVDYVKGDVKIMTIDGVWSWKKFQRYMCIAHVGSFHNRIYFKEYGNFDINYKICGDYELLLRAKEKLRTFKIDRVTVNMEAGGVSNNLVEKAFKETYYAKIKTAKISNFIAKWDFIVASFKHFIKSIFRNN